MTTVFLIRHGETGHNKKDAVTGQLDVPLNSHGEEQAEEAARALEDEDFDAAYSSDLERTYETTRIVAEKHGLHPDACEELREVSFGGYEGQHKDEWRQAVRESERDRRKVSPEDGESLEEAADRFLGKLEEIRDNHPGSKVLVGGHGVVIKAVLMELLGKSYSELEQDNAAVTVLESDGEGWKVVRANDTSHLE
jgi:broad specificity phosphatase PhoE